jgi:hypothetical protein
MNTMIIKSNKIKSDYISSGCQRSDIGCVVDRLMLECNELFETRYQALEFLMIEMDI